jgi:uncharacterized protein
MEIYALRLLPQQDLRLALHQWAITHDIQAGFVLSAIGSLTTAQIRLAGQPTPTTLTGRFEILMLNGLLSCHGLHLHGAIADCQGQTIGGHISDGCIIYTTAEIVIGAHADWVFGRSFDPKTGYVELDITAKSGDGEPLQSHYRQR